ncbi:hypothetical protein Mnod_7961 (plasmid) [Methylobacterium nodulans ORS 2060]|uniref:Uncharacterized protein n=1 Tax=Methylobacterium nodulans (strain LMG 21967 / CNCM I-2342 / ORS 2060) TaxID=460265 RepID=B8IWS3_METNO|nr:hypothetical protein Mnod_7961 [Methylobacterium nodulans ORS 2060]
MSRSAGMIPFHSVQRSAPPAGTRMPDRATAVAQAEIAAAGGAKENSIPVKALASAAVSRRKRLRTQPRCLNCRRDSAGVITDLLPVTAWSRTCSKTAA